MFCDFFKQILKVNTYFNCFKFDEYLFDKMKQNDKNVLNLNLFFRKFCFDNVNDIFKQFFIFDVKEIFVIKFFFSNFFINNRRRVLSKIFNFLKF